MKKIFIIAFTAIFYIDATFCSFSELAQPTVSTAHIAHNQEFFITKKSAVLCAYITAICGLTYLGHKIWRLLYPRNSYSNNSYSIPDCTKIDISGFGDLTVNIDPNYDPKEKKLTITCDKNILENLIVNIQENQLTIRPTCNFTTSSPINYHATVKSLAQINSSGSINATVNGNTQLENVNTSGASKLSVKNNTKSNSLKINASGSSQIILENISTDNVTSQLNGASRIILSGNTDNQMVDTSGASHYDATNLASNNTNATTSGASSAQVQAQKKLSYNASGASSFVYYGDPTIISKRKSVAARARKG